MLLQDFGQPKETIDVPYQDLKRLLRGRAERATRQLTFLHAGTDVRHLTVVVLTWSNECSINRRRLIAVVDPANDRVIDLFTNYTLW
jgi:hypothetical protein